MLTICRLKSQEPTLVPRTSPRLERLPPSTFVAAAAGLAENPGLLAPSYLPGGRRPPGREIDLIYFFCELPLFCEPELAELLAAEPVVIFPEADSLSFMASKTDIPRGPIVIRTGSPSFDLA